MRKRFQMRQIRKLSPHAKDCFGETPKPTPETGALPREESRDFTKAFGATTLQRFNAAKPFCSDLQPAGRNILLNRWKNDSPLCWANIRSRFNCPHPADMAVFVEIPGAAA